MSDLEVKDPLLLVSPKGGSPPKSPPYDPGHDWEKDLRELYTSGKISLITGLMGTGKTDLATLLMWEVNKLGIAHILTNIRLTDKEKRLVPVLKIIEVYDMETAFVEISKIPIGEPIVMFLDEGGIFLGSQFQTKEVVQFIRFTFLMRKFGVALCILCQSSKSIASMISKELLFAEILKDTKTTARLKIIETGDVLRWTHIPRSDDLGYDTNQIATFKSNIYTEGLFSKLLDLPSDEARRVLREHLRGFVIQERTPDGTRKHQRRRDVMKLEAEKIIVGGGGWEEIALRLDVTEPTAHKYLERIRNRIAQGEYYDPENEGSS